MMEEHRDLGGAWLDALDDHAGIPRLNGHERVGQLSGEENPEGLVRDPTDPSVPQPATPSAVEWEADLPAIVTDRYERVDVDNVTGAALGSNVDWRCPGDGTIDHIALPDADRLEEDRDRGRGCHGAADMDLRELAAPKTRRSAVSMSTPVTYSGRESAGN
jgi:hypothetical protein